VSLSESSINFGVVVSNVEAAPVVKLLGDIDHATKDVVTAALRPVVEPKPPGVVVDCSHLRFIDGGGVGALLTGWLAADGGTRFEIRGGSAILKRMISILGIDELLRVDDSKDGISATLPVPELGLRALVEQLQQENTELRQQLREALEPELSIEQVAPG
jgi:stage II sporulation protein AA (anti-sigma F factor antagonist)